MDYIQTQNFHVDSDFFIKCEFIASQLEVTVDYLLDEFYDEDGELIESNFPWPV